MQLVDIVEFTLVGMLGFMPLAIIHWANRNIRVPTERQRRAWWRRLTIKPCLLVAVTNWTSRIVC